MERRKFIKQCCTAVVGTTLIGASLSSCESVKYVLPNKTAEQLSIPVSSFIIEGNKKDKLRKYVLINMGDNETPICVYRIPDNKYVSSLMSCTHQGCELNMAAGFYTCPCHGSEFSAEGKVLTGPADRDLKTFKTELKNEEIIIYLNA
ncbi:MAG: cytochrome b6-f complex iron-sulfur subunit [Arenicella sp.]|jgi:cytochrome b6-f complex iron-sulfur subunit